MYLRDHNDKQSSYGYDNVKWSSFSQLQRLENIDFVQIGRHSCGFSEGIILFNAEISQVIGLTLDKATTRVEFGDDTVITHLVLFHIEVDTTLESTGICSSEVQSHVKDDWVG